MAMLESHPSGSWASFETHGSNVPPVKSSWARSNVWDMSPIRLFSFRSEPGVVVCDQEDEEAASSVSSGALVCLMKTWAAQIPTS